MFVIFIYSLIKVANNAYEEQDRPQKESINQVEAQKNITVNLTDKNCENVIKNFIENCTKGNYEKAYSYLSQNCKKDKYPTLDDFVNNYCNLKTIRGNVYTIEKVKDISKYTYKIEFNNKLSTGKANSRKTIEYYSITVDNGQDIKINID